MSGMYHDYCTTKDPRCKWYTAVTRLACGRKLLHSSIETIRSADVMMNDAVYVSGINEYRNTE